MFFFFEEKSRFWGCKEKIIWSATFCRFERILLFNYEIWNRFFFLCRVVSVIIVWTWRQVSTWSVSFVNPLNFYKNPIINPISSTVIHRRRLLSFALTPTTTTTTNMLFCLSIRFLSKFFGSPQSSYFLKKRKQEIFEKWPRLKDNLFLSFKRFKYF